MTLPEGLNGANRQPPNSLTVKKRAIFTVNRHKVIITEAVRRFQDLSNITI